MRYPLLPYLIFLTQLRLVTVEAADCDASTCETNFKNLGPGPALNCYVDPTDPSNLGSLIAICPCIANEPVGGPVIYTGLDHGITTAQPVNSAILTEAFVYDTVLVTYNVPLTAILPDSPVTISVVLGPPVEATGSYTYTQQQSQSVFQTGITTTVVSTVLVPSTTIQINTEVDVTVLAAATITSLCTTGVRTIKASTRTSIITVTSTPVVRTVTKNVDKTVTTTLTCIPGATSKAQARSPRANALQNRQVLSIGYEAPRCDGTPASSITIVTSTTVSTSLTTQTVVDTSYSTTTTHSTSTPKPSTVCHHVKGTTTVTPTTTKTSTKHLTTKTSTVTHTHTCTRTIVPKHLQMCSKAKVAAIHTVQQPLHSAT